MAAIAIASSGNSGGISGGMAALLAAVMALAALSGGMAAVAAWRHNGGISNVDTAGFKIFFSIISSPGSLSKINSLEFH